MPPTSVIEFLSWGTPVSSRHAAEYPTPSAAGYGSSGNAGGGNTASRGRPSLETMARRGLWPTPLSVDGSKGKVRYSGGNPGLALAVQEQPRLWPTPTAADSHGHGYHRTPSGMKLLALPGAVQMYPTPLAGDAHLSSTPEAAARRLAEGRRTLSRVVQSEIFPTPNATDGKAGGRIPDGRRGRQLRDLAGPHVDEWMWPTPKASPSGPDFARAEREASGGDDLATAVAKRTWPTPTTRDYKDSGANTDYESLRGRSHLSAEVNLEGGTGGQLNPTWVEWLQGFPCGWTDLGPSGTASYRKSRSGSRAASSKRSTKGKGGGE